MLVIGNGVCTAIASPPPRQQSFLHHCCDGKTPASLLRMVISLLRVSLLGCVLGVVAPVLAIAEESAAESAASYSIFVSSDESGSNSVREYTPTGTLIRRITFNHDSGQYPAGESIGDLVVDEGGILNVYNGWQAGLLTRYDPAKATFTHSRFPGWDGARGGIATHRNYIFAADSARCCEWAPSGVVRFDTSTGAAARFANGVSAVDVAMGLDGKLYVLYQSWDGMNINAYDPETMVMLARVNIAYLAQTVAPETIAVDQYGRIYVAGLRSYIYRLNPDGTPNLSLDTGIYYLMDIDVDADGQLIVGTRSGLVLRSDTDLTGFRTLVAGLATVHPVYVTIAKPLPNPPPLQLRRASSRKTHGAGETFDVELPLTGAPGVECRGKADDFPQHRIIFTFSNAIASVGHPQISGGVAQWYSSGIAPGGHEYIVALAGVMDAQVVRVTLPNITDVAGNHLQSVSASIALLRGDVNGDRVVNSGDAIITRNRAGLAVDATTFRADVSVDGSIGSADAMLVRNGSGNSVPLPYK